MKIFSICMGQNANRPRYEEEDSQEFAHLIKPRKQRSVRGKISSFLRKEKSYSCVDNEEEWIVNQTPNLLSQEHFTHDKPTMADQLLREIAAEEHCNKLIRQRLQYTLCAVRQDTWEDSMADMPMLPPNLTLASIQDSSKISQVRKTVSFNDEPKSTVIPRSKPVLSTTKDNDQQMTSRKAVTTSTNGKVQLIGFSDEFEITRGPMYLNMKVAWSTYCTNHPQVKAVLDAATGIALGDDNGETALMDFVDNVVPMNSRPFQFMVANSMLTDHFIEELASSMAPAMKNALLGGELIRKKRRPEPAMIPKMTISRNGEYEATLEIEFMLENQQ